jgi:outer membrane protein OmpA-like peptidoglycan-associated protein
MNDNPSIVIELGSHTDSRGSATSNQSLSQKRAQSAVDYIVKKGGIASSRISAKGYGESALKNQCADGVTCSETEHQQNRRTEIRVVGVK